MNLVIMQKRSGNAALRIVRCMYLTDAAVCLTSVFLVRSKDSLARLMYVEMATSMSLAATIRTALLLLLMLLLLLLLCVVVAAAAPDVMCGSCRRRRN